MGASSTSKKTKVDKDIYRFSARRRRVLVAAANTEIYPDPVAAAAFSIFGSESNLRDCENQNIIRASI